MTTKGKTKGPVKKRPSRNGTPEERKVTAARVIAAIEGGLSCYRACESVGMTVPAFHRCCDDSPELSSAYARAREILVDRMAQELADIADEPATLTPDGKVDSAAVQKQRLQVDTRKWLLSKLAPKKYGDRLEVAGDASSPLQAAVTVSFVGSKP